jgi:hypothetical protein
MAVDSIRARAPLASVLQPSPSAEALLGAAPATSDTLDPAADAIFDTLDVPVGRPERFVSLSPEGQLVYHPDALGNRVPDFSTAGYGGGGVRLPNVPVVRTVSPADGDDTAAIQAAIDQVSGLPPDANGFRGAVLLTRGQYQIASSLTVRTSGVVLRGEGDGEDGTILLGTGRGKRSLVTVVGAGTAQEVPGSRVRILDTYVPVGARSFQVATTAGLQVGDRVVIHRPSPQEWIDLIGMDACGRRGTAYDTSDQNGKTCLENPWAPGSKDLRFERVVTGIVGNEVTVDAPVMNALEAELGGAELYRVDTSGRLSQVGVENLRGDSTYDAGKTCREDGQRYPCDEKHAWTFIELQGVENAWVKNTSARHFGYSAVHVRNSRSVTVQDSRFLDGVSKIEGGNRYPFNIDDSHQVLVQRVQADTGRHDFVLGSLTEGPNVFLDATSLRAYADSGPHHRWATGALFDNVQTKALNLRNRGNLGTGHGWVAANSVVWRSYAEEMEIQSPPGATNWALGVSVQRPTGDGPWDANAADLPVRSLFLKQLEERLGPQAVLNIAATR